MNNKPALQPLHGTDPLTMDGDIASRLVAGVDKFLLRKLAESVERRPEHWSRDFSSSDAYAKSVEPNRERLAHIVGLRDARVARIECGDSVVGRGNGYSVAGFR